MSKPTLTLTLRKPEESRKKNKPKITLKPKITKPKITLKPKREEELIEVNDLLEESFGSDDDEEFLLSDMEYLKQVPHNESGPPNPCQIDSFLPPKHELDEVMKLNARQQKALKYIVDQSKVLSEKAQSKLEQRLLKLGYNHDQMLRLRLYIRDEAQIIIHLKPEIIKLLYDQKETHYRNAFEVISKLGKKTNWPLSSRTKWESRMFNKIYDKSKPYERVKYGVLNILNDPYGVLECYGYGDCYLQLKGVRLRTTFADQDTASSSSRIASCEYYGHVLENYSDIELKLIMQSALGDQTFVKRSHTIGSYKEIQIHGDVNLREHVALLVVNPKHRSKFQETFEAFSAYYDIPMIWMDEYV